MPLELAPCDWCEKGRYPESMERNSVHNLLTLWVVGCSGDRDDGNDDDDCGLHYRRRNFDDCCWRCLRRPGVIGHALGGKWGGGGVRTIGTGMGTDNCARKTGRLVFIYVCIFIHTRTRTHTHTDDAQTMDFVIDACDDCPTAAVVVVAAAAAPASD
jgi:hypothetical protein